MRSKQKHPKTAALSQISQLIGTVPALLPEEPEDIYLAGLQATITELEATTPLQVFLAEKIFDCIWWIRRYETQKRSSLVKAMGERLGRKTQDEEEDSFDKALLMMALSENKWDFKPLQESLDHHSLTLEALLQEATYNCRGYLKQIEENVALKVKTLAGLQASYETLANRKQHSERLRLQNELLRRDLEAIDVPALTVEGAKHVQPAKASGQ